jgi:hypothetical protein
MSLKANMFLSSHLSKKIISIPLFTFGSLLVFYINTKSLSLLNVMAPRRHHVGWVCQFKILNQVKVYKIKY